MEKIPFSFETISLVLENISKRLDSLEKKIDVLLSEKKEVTNEWMNIKELCAYLPSHPAEQTVYGWTSSHQIPYYKRGKGIMFRTSEIEKWLSSGVSHKSERELEAEAEEYINSRRMRR